MSLFWTEQAEGDLDAIVSYIADESIEYALAFDERVRNGLLLLAKFSESGREGRVAGTREWILPQDRCIVVYQIQGDDVLILRLIHGGQEWPQDI